MDLNSLFAPFLMDLHAILDRLDSYELDDEMDELNSELEDILYMLDCSDFENEDDEEELFEALDEIEDLLERYHLVTMRREDILREVAGLSSILRQAKVVLD